MKYENKSVDYKTAQINRFYGSMCDQLGGLFLCLIPSVSLFISACLSLEISCPLSTPSFCHMLCIRIAILCGQKNSSIRDFSRSRFFQVPDIFLRGSEIFMKRKCGKLNPDWSMLKLTEIEIDLFIIPNRSSIFPHSDLEIPRNLV